MYFSQHLTERLSSRIVGQDLAVREMVRALTLARSQIKVRPGPLGAYLFLGPTGTGKSALAHAVARELYGNPDVVIPLHLAGLSSTVNFVESLGFHVERCGALHTEKGAGGANTRYCQGVVVIEDYREAEAELRSLICQILDHGRIHLGEGDVFDFSRSLFVFKCRSCSNRLDELNASSIGFSPPSDDDDDDEVDEKIYQLARRCVEDEFSTEFVGRLDRVMVFKRLKREQLPVLLRTALSETFDAFRRRGYQDVEISVEEGLEELLLEKGSRRLHLGARPLMRNVRKYVAFPLADLAVSGALVRGTRVWVGLENGRPVARYTYRPAIERQVPEVKLLPAQRRNGPPAA